MSAHPSLRVRKFEPIRMKSHPNQVKASERKRRKRINKQIELQKLAAIQGISVSELVQQRFLEVQRFIRQTNFESVQKARKFLEESRRYSYWY